MGERKNNFKNEPRVMLSCACWRYTDSRLCTGTDKRHDQKCTGYFWVSKNTTQHAKYV